MNRDLCLAEITDITNADLQLPESLKPFVLFTAFDATHLGEVELRPFAQSVLRAGCVYACSWGAASGRVEVEFDLAAIDAERAGGRFVVTTSHEDDSLDDALWFAVFCVWSGDVDTRAVISLCSSDLTSELEMRLSNCEHWSTELMRKEER